MTTTLATRLVPIAPARPVCFIGPRLLITGASPWQAQRLRETFDFRYPQRVKRDGKLVVELADYPVVTGPDERMEIPYGCLLRVQDILGDCCGYDDRWTVSPSPVDPFVLVRHHGERNGQRDALEGFWKANGARGRGGVILAPCGAGKSWIGCRLIGALQRTTLIVCHTQELLDQWIANLTVAFPAQDIGIIAHGKWRVTDLTVALIQTLYRDTKQVEDRFGVVINDEAHHLPAGTFAEVSNILRARVKIGLTASENRADGLSPLVTALCGPVVARITQDAMTADGVVLAPTVRVVRSQFGWQGDAATNFTRMTSALVEDGDRNALLAGEAIRAMDTGRHVLALSSRVDHLHEIAAFVEAWRPGLVQVLTGRESKKARRTVMARLRAGFPLTLATTPIAKEGLDAPVLDTLLWLTPVRNPVTCQQAVGRIQRTGKDVTPLVIDVRDDGVFPGDDLDALPSYARVLYHQWRQRVSVYNSLNAGWEK